MKKINNLVFVFLSTFSCCMVIASQNGFGMVEFAPKMVRVSQEELREHCNKFASRRAALVLSEKIRSSNLPQDAAQYVDVALKNTEFKDFKAFKDAGYTPTNYSLLMAADFMNSDAIISIRQLWPEVKPDLAVEYINQKLLTLDPAKKNSLLTFLSAKI